ncbi:hypothetical protein B0H17DRAFT_1213253 [Mycena rosella]|uniref:Uncharacterized protein n=1 Tax=Mycena rosella TaxID=1033263 RepID=A0AAD7G228_MYCRO|nr:hypothetical protein B0H17DRAFT_1213253 [Mycena rosella]
MTDPVASLSLDTTVSNNLETPLITLRIPHPIAEEEVNTDQPDKVDFPLVTLRALAEPDNNRLVFDRSPSPTLMEEADNQACNLEYILGLDQALPPPSSARSMRNETICSFESRPCAADIIPVVTEAAPDAAMGNAPPKSAPKKKAAVSKAKLVSHSPSLLSMTEPAPSDKELYKIADLLPAPKKKESALEFRSRTEENNPCLITWMLTLQKALDDNERLTSPAASSSLSLNTTSDIAHLKKLMAEGRDVISKVTECVNSLVDIPVQLEGLKRAASSSAPPRLAPEPDSHCGNSSSTTKRARTFSPIPEPPAKHHKALEDRVNDVYMWTVHLDRGSLFSVGKLALEAVKINTHYLHNAIHPKNMPCGLLSLRFNDAGVATQFLDRMHTNPPSDMVHLCVYWGRDYGKGKVSADKVFARKEDKPW